MKRPYVFCHMLISIDGKIMGNYMDTPQGIKAGDIFYDIAFGKKPYYHHQGWLSGRVTTDDNFTFYKKPQLDENAPQVPKVIISLMIRQRCTMFLSILREDLDGKIVHWSMKIHKHM